jgi:hypothetical protein
MISGGSFRTSAAERKYKKILSPTPENNETTPFEM